MHRMVDFIYLSNLIFYPFQINTPFGALTFTHTCYERCTPRGVTCCYNCIENKIRKSFLASKLLNVL